MCPRPAVSHSSTSEDIGQALPLAGQVHCEYHATLRVGTAAADNRVPILVQKLFRCDTAVPNSHAHIQQTAEERKTHTRKRWQRIPH